MGVGRKTPFRSLDQGAGLCLRNAAHAGPVLSQQEGVASCQRGRQALSAAESPSHGPRQGRESEAILGANE